MAQLAAIYAFCRRTDRHQCAAPEVRQPVADRQPLRTFPAREEGKGGERTSRSLAAFGKKLAGRARQKLCISIGMTLV